MEDVNQLQNTPFEKQGTKALPGSLNTLTILTFIGCGISLLSVIWGFVGARESYNKIEQMQGSDAMEKMPGFLKNMMGPDALELARKSLENRVPMLIIGLVSVALCLYGAIQMRKLQKQGFYLWLTGEVLPIIGTIIFIGFGIFSGFAMIGLLIPVLFIILYATQLKYLH